MPYKSFAVAGAGGLGSFIVKALADKGVDVVVLSRSNEVKVPAGVKVIAVDYGSEDSLKEALSGVEVVISTLSQGGFAFQTPLFEAAKAAGVKLAVPSEFGNHTTDLPEDSPLYFKKQTQEFLKSINLDYALIWNGPFTDTTFVPFLGFNWSEHKVDIIGEGNNPVPLTTREDIARFLVHILTTLPNEKLANETFIIQGDTVSFNDVVKLYEETHGTRVTINHTSIEDAQAYIKANPGLDAFLAYLRLSWDINPASKENETAHHLFPDWNPTKVKDVIKAL